MMHNTYSNYSLITSLRITYFASNDLPCYEKCSSNYYCSCCLFNVNSLILPMIINPSLLYGLRQSTLIQCPPSRRVVLGSSDQYGFRSSIYNVGNCCCVKKGSGCKEKKSGGGGVDEIRVRARRLERDFRCNALDDAEAMLSLLSEEGNEGCGVIRDRRKRSSKVARVLKERNVVVEKCKGLGNLERKSKKQQSGFGEVYLKDEGHERRKERESRLINEERRSRRGESCSSTYSLSESGDSESESEVDVKQERFVGESSTRKGKDSRKTGGVVISEVNDDVLERCKVGKDQQLISSKRDDARVGSSTEWDWRKKSEKKLTDESVEDTRSRKDSIMRQSKLSRVNEGSSIMASTSKKQFSDLEEESTLDVSSRRQSRYSNRKDDSLSEYMKSSGRREHSTTDLRSYGNSESQVSEHLVTGSQHEQPTSGASSSGGLKSQVMINNQASEYLKCRQQHQQLSQTSRQNVESTSTTIRRPVQGKGVTVVGQSVQETECGYCKECGRSVQENTIESDIEQHAEHSEISGDARWTTTTHNMLERYGKQEIGTSSSETLVEDVGEWDKLHLAAGQVDARRISGQHSETLDCDYGYGRTTRRKQNQPEMRIKNLADISTSDLKISQEGLSGIMKETESRKILQTGASASHVSSASVEIKCHSASGERINDEQTYSTSKLKSAKELVEKHQLVNETFVQTTLRTEVQRPVLQGGLTEFFSGEADTSQTTVGSVSQTGAQQVSEVEVQSDLQLSVISPSLQLTEINSSDSEPESSFLRKGTGSRSTEVDSGSGYSQPQATRSSSSDGASQSGIGFVQVSPLKDTTNSAERMHESSTQIVEIMRRGSSTSETKIDKELSQGDKKHMLTGSTHPLADETSFMKLDLSHGSKELFDDMWDAKDHSVEEVSESESMEAEIYETEGVAARRTGKSLWNIGAGIFRLPWGSTSETQKSPVKSSQQRSSNDSASGEIWFSGNEHDEGTGDGMKGKQITMSEEPSPSDQSLIMRTAFRNRQDDWKKKRSISMPQEPTSELPLLRESATRIRKKDRRKKEQRDMSQEPSLDKSLQRRTTNRTQKGDFKLMNIIDQLDPVEVNVSSSSSASQGDSVSGSVSIGANTGLKVTQQQTSLSRQPSPLAASAGRLRRSDALKEIEELEKIEEHISSTSEQRESSPQDVSIPSARQLIRTDVFEEVGRIEEFVSSTSETKGHSIDVMESGVPSEEADTELKRRRLQRSKQVISDRFDEWEDAYRRENEQRKIDEIFMRAALAEAMKAADSWEVPVGAVLVQNGKIVARGYNLVEELRDSTAHAEMICIRDASKILRTWRLSETTMYVTLEPCPMCAGAILQARIGTLVWGAPNKLLGADGSWIRLFPDGVEGEERSEVAGKPAAPPHPFHTKMNIRRGVLGPECAQVMQQFFQLRRKNEKEKHKRSEEEGQPSRLPVPHKPAKLLRKMHDVFHVK